MDGVAPGNVRDDEEAAEEPRLADSEGCIVLVLPLVFVRSRCVMIQGKSPSVMESYPSSIAKRKIKKTKC